jgi:hypothetical protein
MTDGQRFAIDVRPEASQPEWASVTVVFVGDPTGDHFGGKVRWKSFVPAILEVAHPVNCPHSEVMKQLDRGKQVSFATPAVKDVSVPFLRQIIDQHRT